MSIGQGCRLSTAPRSPRLTCHGKQPIAGPSRIRPLHAAAQKAVPIHPTLATASQPPTPSDELGSLPGSVHLFLTRKSTLPLWIQWMEPSMVPIVPRLPPLPIIHDHALAQAAVDHTPAGLELVERLALLGDAILAERAIHSLDQTGVAKTSGHLTRFKAPLIANKTLSHLGLVYGLHRLIRVHPTLDRIPQRSLATTFEAWIAAAQIDAAMRGPKALANLDNILYKLFQFEAWENLLQEAPAEYRSMDQFTPLVKLYGSKTSPSTARPDPAELASIVISSDPDGLFDSANSRQLNVLITSGSILPTTLHGLRGHTGESRMSAPLATSQSVELEGHPARPIDTEELRLAQEATAALSERPQVPSSHPWEIPTSGAYFPKNMRQSTVEEAGLVVKLSSSRVRADMSFPSSPGGGRVIEAVHAAKKLCADALKLKIEGKK